MPGQPPFPFAWAESPYHLESLIVVYADVAYEVLDELGRFLTWACNARPGDASEFHSIYLIVAVRGDARDETGQLFSNIASGDLGAPVYP